MKRALRKWNVDSIPGQDRIDRCVDIMGDRQALVRIGHKDTQFEVERTVAMVHEKDGRWRLPQHIRVIFHDPDQQRANLVEVRAIGHADRQHEPGDCVVKGPVGDVFGDQGLVRDDHYAVTEIGDRGGADRDISDRAAEGSVMCNTNQSPPFRGRAGARQREGRASRVERRSCQL